MAIMPRTNSMTQTAVENACIESSVSLACESSRGFDGIGVAYDDAAMMSIDQILTFSSTARVWLP